MRRVSLGRIRNNKSGPCTRVVRINRYPTQHVSVRRIASKVETPHSGSFHPVSADRLKKPIQTSKGRKEIPLSLFRQLPKAELHLHLDILLQRWCITSLLTLSHGAIRPSTVIELAKEQGVNLPTYNVEEFTKMVSVGDTAASLVEYLKPFDYVLSVLQKPCMCWSWVMGF
jgi:hypothetical protein